MPLKRRDLLAGAGLQSALLLAGCGGGGSSAAMPPQPLLELRARHALGLAWASSSINVPVFREQSIVATDDGGFVAAYFDPDGLACLHRLSALGADRGRVLLRPRLSDALLADGHCAISLGLSPDGLLHAMFGAHDTKPLYFAAPLTELWAAADGSERRAQIWPRHISYPQFYTLGGRFELWFRADPANEVHRLAYDASSGRFAAASETLLTPGSAERVYMNQLAVGGRHVALSWMYRLASSDDFVRNEGIGLAWSADAGVSWRDPTGAALQWPVTRGQSALVAAVPASQQPLNQTSSRFGPDGRLYLTWYAQDVAGRHQIMLGVVAPQGRLLSVEAVSDSDTRFDLLGRGTLVLPLSRPQVVASQRHVHVVYRQGDLLRVASRTLAGGGGWHHLRLEAGGLRAWEPSISAAHWERWQRLVVYVQPASQGERDTAGDLAPQPAQLLEFAEPA